MTEADAENKRRKQRTIVIATATVFVLLIFVIGLSVGLSGRNKSSESSLPAERAPTQVSEDEVEAASEATLSPTSIPTSSPIAAGVPTSQPVDQPTSSPTVSAFPSVSDISSSVPTLSPPPAATERPTSHAPTPQPTASPTKFEVRQQWPSDGGGLRVTVHNAMSGKWQDVINDVMRDWERGTPDAIQFTRHQVAIDPGCTPEAGVIKICNSDKGQSGGNRGFIFLLLSGNQISGATVEMNDYFLTSEKLMRHYLCQYIGQALGLKLTDQDFFNANTGSCMDLSNILDESMLSPSQADYEQLASYYGSFRRALRTSGEAA